LKGVDFTSVSAKWRQPSVTCPTNGARVSFWVGLDTKTIEQVGTIVLCKAAHKPPTYRAWWEMYIGKNSPGAKPFAVSPGDMIQASVSYPGLLPPGVFVLEVKDLTNGRSFRDTKSCAAGVTCKRNAAEWIVERPGGGKYALADYGSVAFLDDRASGTAKSSVQFTMVHAGTTLSTCRAIPNVFPIGPGNGGISCTWHASN
jgi:hypothetical protein